MLECRATSLCLAQCVRILSVLLTAIHPSASYPNVAISKKLSESPQTRLGSEHSVPLCKHIINCEVYCLVSAFLLDCKPTRAGTMAVLFIAISSMPNPVHSFQ